MKRALSGRSSCSHLDHLYLGKAGEAFVTAHLLRRGFNAALVSIDSGVDILAHQELLPRDVVQAEQVLYQFQVKTTAADKYQAGLPVHKVHELWHKAINLVVVFWPSDGLPDAVVLPPTVIRMFTSGGFDDPSAPIRLKSGKVSLKVFRKSGEYYVGNMSNPVTAMLNRFDLVEPVGTDTGTFPYFASWGQNGQAVVLAPHPNRG